MLGALSGCWVPWLGAMMESDGVPLLGGIVGCYSFKFGAYAELAYFNVRSICPRRAHQPWRLREKRTLRSPPWMPQRRTFGAAAASGGCSAGGPDGRAVHPPARHFALRCAGHVAATSHRTGLVWVGCFSFPVWWFRFFVCSSAVFFLLWWGGFRALPFMCFVCFCPCSFRGRQPYL